jgi:hypothetical protein
LAEAGVARLIQIVERLLGDAVVAVVAATGRDPRDRFRSLYVTSDDALAAIAPDVTIDGREAVDALASCDALGLVHHFGLDPLDHALAILALAPDIEPRLGRVFAYLNDDLARQRPTIDLGLRLLVGDPDARLAAAARVATDAPLVHLGLIERPQPSVASALGEPLLPTHGLVAGMLGDDDLADRLPGARQVSPQPCGIHAESLAPIFDAWERLCAAAPVARLALVGGDAEVRRRVAAHLAATIQSPLLALKLDAAAADAANRRADARREALLRGAVLYVEGDLSVLDGHPGPAIADGGLDMPTVAIPPLTTAGRRILWERGLDDPDLAKVAADRLLLDAAAIDRTSTLARGSARGTGRPLTMADVASAARVDARGRLSALSPAIDPRTTWDDLVLPDLLLDQLRTLVDRVAQRTHVHEEWGFGRSRGSLGVSALFAGPSGTGKSMAAEVLAAELDVPLWRIDLARVVSKYIGETEKNLDAVFEAAEASAAMLLFDEADALFGKRSEVQDAHDRYANLEIAYLLQRMETYDGVVVLSTNLLRHIDDAFARRLTFTLHFPFPDAALRRRLWRGAWPREAPLDVDADLDALGEEHALSGANITNAVLHAAHLAAAEGEVISNEHLQRGVDLERSKLGWIAPLEVVR